MQRLPLFAVIVLSSACDAAVTASADVAPEPVVAEANAVVAADANAGVAVVADADAAAAAKVEISADAFKLGEVTTLIQDGTIESAAELELAINDPEAGINRVDIDLDGQVDHVQVVEVRHEADARVDFQMRVVPSSHATVVHSVELATASVVAARATSEVAFSASFSAGVGFSAGASASVYSFVAPARFEASAVVVAQPLLAFAFVAERPVYASVFVEADSGRWIPPGHLKRGHWKATGGHPGGHGKFRDEALAHGSVGAKGHGHGKVAVGGHGSGKGSAGFGPGKGGGASKGSHHPGPGKGGSVGGASKGGGGAPKQASKGGGGGGPKGGGSGSKGGGGGGKGKK